VLYIFTSKNKYKCYKWILCKPKWVFSTSLRSLLCKPALNVAVNVYPNRTQSMNDGQISSNQGVSKEILAHLSLGKYWSPVSFPHPSTTWSGTLFSNFTHLILSLALLKLHKRLQESWRKPTLLGAWIKWDGPFDTTEYGTEHWMLHRRILSIEPNVGIIWQQQFGPIIAI
jgi:hypothetical protein